MPLSVIKKLINLFSFFYAPLINRFRIKAAYLLNNPGLTFINNVFKIKVMLRAQIRCTIAYLFVQNIIYIFLVVREGVRYLIMHFKIS